jgi:acetyl-CoA carboxylase carboxyl transferase subunit alpha
MSNESKPVPLDFEEPLMSLAQQIETLEGQLQNQPELENDVKRLHEQYQVLKRSIYSNLRPIDHLALARHAQRPYARDYFERFDKHWIELHGDRRTADDPALVSGLLTIGPYKVVVIGTDKGRNLRQKQTCNFGMPQPEGYRKALRMFEHAEKFGLPIITLIDTPGAYPGMTAEEHNQAEAIALNLRVLASLTVPVIAVVTGEGGSGGALAIGLANRILKLEHSVYSVISPEGCASILWRSSDKVAAACEAMKMTAAEIKQIGVVDEVVKEPLGGAHKEYDETAKSLQAALIKHLDSLTKLSRERVKQDRLNKYRKIGSTVE